MGINLGSNLPINYNIGISQVNSIHLGNTQVWPNGGYILGPSARACYSSTDFTPAPISTSSVSTSNVYVSLFVSTSINTSAFQGCAITSSRISNVTIIGSASFAQCTLLVTASFIDAQSIGDSAFQQCTALTSVLFPNVTTIGSYAFRRANITSASFPNATYLVSNAFQGCPIEYLETPKVQYIGDYCFSEYSDAGKTGSFIAKSVSFPSATIIGTGSFQGGLGVLSKLVSASFPNVTKIGDYAFNRCVSLLETPTFGNVTSMGQYAFSSCSAMITASIPSAQYVSFGAFYQCTSLISASFISAKTVGDSAFDTCTSVKWINLPALSGSTAIGGSVLNTNVFNLVPNTGYITVPSRYSASNAGAPDGDLVYLKTAPRNWTINYI